MTIRALLEEDQDTFWSHNNLLQNEEPIRFDTTEVRAYLDFKASRRRKIAYRLWTHLYYRFANRGWNDWAWVALKRRKKHSAWSAFYDLNPVAQIGVGLRETEDRYHGVSVFAEPPKHLFRKP